MGNQQERLAYLAGVIDGEGWVGATVYKDSIRPTVCVHIVAPDWADALDRIVRECGLPSYVCHFKNSSRWGISGIKRVSRFIPEVRPFLVNKTEQADLLMELCEERLKRHYHTRQITDREWGLINKIKSLNTKGKNPQRLYAERREAKIESELARDRKSDAEMTSSLLKSELRTEGLPYVAFYRE